MRKELLVNATPPETRAPKPEVVTCASSTALPRRVSEPIPKVSETYGSHAPDSVKYTRPATPTNRAPPPAVESKPPPCAPKPLSAASAPNAK